jgi:hypothetical protein
MGPDPMVIGTDDVALGEFFLNKTKVTCARGTREIDLLFASDMVSIEDIVGVIAWLTLITAILATTGLFILLDISI